MFTLTMFIVLNAYRKPNNNGECAIPNKLPDSEHEFEFHENESEYNQGQLYRVKFSSTL